MSYSKTCCPETESRERNQNERTAFPNRPNLYSCMSRNVSPYAPQSTTTLTFCFFVDTTPLSLNQASTIGTKPINLLAHSNNTDKNTNTDNRTNQTTSASAAATTTSSCWSK